MNPKTIRTGVRVLVLGAGAYILMGVAYVACIVAACW